MVQHDVRENLLVAQTIVGLEDPLPLKLLLQLRFNLRANQLLDVPDLDPRYLFFLEFVADSRTTLASLQLRLAVPATLGEKHVLALELTLELRVGFAQLIRLHEDLRKTELLLRWAQAEPQRQRGSTAF